ncbi:MAG: hypothetical protein COW00_00070 [Bdellovibrio sp. CG12_big_fil_rev_8_21_14_0_65_39_13]|nr:MAG: hypothetical protein COW78_20025 [Bdellovibrio sp. CG22_combo_CG10-13_8_21_14_all_39_27]PIQ62878.1 MAG: hypothetical protein COW00_00070 [Bdellovibrio sp. CG12_big_fil_rev_8_21_14_0_65_39_13]PIR33233.1 MAG: hypothetical protein COV37_16805 [Bdellovibrio sp. CG11_big_fil_rev_8_21_14_0_20_39_38]PJB54017.1 MAG: hypothetical protein CO099_03965 [Bdellovibrio sp. CG_4_9_14_3_um_filter_39_7]
MKTLKQELIKFINLITKNERRKNGKVNQLATAIESMTTTDPLRRRIIMDEDYLGIVNDPEFMLAR